MEPKKVRLGIVGVGNCASALVQGLTAYARARADAPVAGLMNPVLGGYHVADIDVAAAFDISAAKVGLDVGEAIFADPNNTLRFAACRTWGVPVERGPTLDGLGRYVEDDIALSPEPEVNVAQILKARGVDVLVSYLPVGAQRAAEYYAQQALEAGCALVNCMPVFLASDPVWARRFERRGLPIIGDDIKSQVGATIIHRMLANLFRERGVRLDRTSQLNVGGNTDFKNMLERERLVSKKLSKTRAVASQIGEPLEDGAIHIGPSDFVPWLADRKWAHIRLEGTGFGGSPMAIELKLEVWDSPNSAGVVIDAVRCARLGLDRGLAGPLLGPSSYFMKSPPEQYTDHEARERTLRFIAGEAVQPARLAS
ncbi:MAG TPA: inositol-3-phosphate synthase [Caulobacteraceae bacterium]|nr:inositol-3-phosphate synthase [Caulobacteraceae bacterium]